MTRVDNPRVLRNSHRLEVRSRARPVPNLRTVVRFLGAFSRRRDIAHTGTPRTAGPDVVATLLDGPTKPASELVSGDVLIIEPGCLIPCDGTVIDGIAVVDESAITGESAPVLHESASGRSAVIAGTRVVSGWIVIKI